MNRRLLVVAVLFPLEAVGFALLVTESLAGALAVVGVTVASLWVHVVLHECGHLVAALVLRLPVVAVRIAPFTGWRSEVVVVRSPSMPALRARMVALAVAGPAANLGTAAALIVAANATGPVTVRLALYGAALTATLLGVVNLVPASSPRSDGAHLFHWLLRPAAMRAALAAAYFQDEVGGMLRTIVTPDGDDDARRALADFIRRCGAGPPDRDADYLFAAKRLLALAHDADREVAAAIRQTLTLQFGMWYLRSAVMSGEPVARTETAEIAGLAQSAFDADPTARVPLALAHLLNHRPDEARSLLLDVPPDAGLFPVAVLLRAVAERCLGAPADPPVADDRYPHLAEVVAAARAADPMPPLFAPA